MKIVVIGYGEVFANLILGSIDSGHKVVGVFRHEKVLINKVFLFFKDIFAPSKDKTFIKTLKLKEINAKSVNSKEFKKEILKLNPDIIFVGSWSEKIKKEAFCLPKIAMINCHPSLLPKYRGPNPYAQVILHMEKQTGVTFHLVDENYDSGAILLQKTVDILPEDTGLSLKNRCASAVYTAVQELLNELQNDIIVPVPQNVKEATYFRQFDETSFILDFNKTSKELDAYIRGVSPWLSLFFFQKNSFFTFKSHEIKDYNGEFDIPGTVVEINKKEVSILCSDKKVIILKQVKIFDCIFGFFTSIYLKMFLKKGTVINE